MSLPALNYFRYYNDRIRSAVVVNLINKNEFNVNTYMLLTIFLV